MDKIQVRQIADPERDQVQREIIARVEANPDEFIERYKRLEYAFEGRYVAADLFKETIEPYRASREARNRYNIPVHNSAAALAAEQLNRVLKEPKEAGRDTVLFLTGIPGSGKTSTVLFEGQLPPRCHAVYEGQLADARFAIPKIQAALDAGFKPVINVIHANPEIALDNTYIRFNEHGRGAGANAIAKIQADLPVGLTAIREHFGDQVDLVIHDRRTPEREQKLVGWNHVGILRSEGTYEQIRHRLLDKTARDYRAGRISYDCYLQAASRPPRRHARRMVRSSSESQGTDGNRRGVSERGSKGNLVRAEEGVDEERQYLAVPYAEREAAKAAGAKWDWREKLWYIGPEGTRACLAKWLPENAAAAAPTRANPREEFAAVLRELGGDLTGAHPIMDGRTHRMTTLDDDRGEKSLFYVAHSDGRPAGYAKNNRTGEEQRWKASAVTMSKEQFTAIAAPGKLAEREADRVATWEKTAERLRAQLETYPALSADHHFDGNQAGARILIDIVDTHDLRVTFTDDQLNAQIELRRVQNDLDRGRPAATAQVEQTWAQRRGAGASASGSTPVKKIAGNPANQQDGEVFVDAGAAAFDFDKKNELNYFVRTITAQGEQRVYWGKDLPRALEEAGAKVGDSITPRRVDSKPVTVEQVQEQPDGTKQVVRVDTKRGQWQVDNHGVNRLAVIKAYDGLVKTPEERKRLEKSAPLLVAARDAAVVELKREKLATELAQRNSHNRTVRL